MELWSDGSSAVVYDDFGLTFFEGDELKEVCSISGEQIFLGAKKGLKSTKPRFLAVNPETRFALVGEAGEVPYWFDLTRKTDPQRHSFAWGSALHLQGGRYFAVLPEEGRLFFRFVELNSSGRVIDEIEPKIPQIIEAEAGPVLWDRPTVSREQLASRQGEKTAAVGPFSMQHNQFGLAVADLGSGLVLFAEPGAPDFSLALSFPVTGDETLLPCPTAFGLAVCVSLRKNHSALAIFNFQGEKLFSLDKVGRRLLTGAGIPFVTSNRALAFPHSTENSVLAELDLQTFELLAETPIPGGSTFYDSLFRIDQDQLVLSSVGFVCRLKREGGTWSGTVLERTQIPKKAAVLRTEVSGQPSLQLESQSKSWAAAIGERTTLELIITNSGGAGSGIEVELSGDAIEGGLVKPVLCRAGGRAAEFSARGSAAVASITELSIPAAFEKALKRTKLETSSLPEFIIELEGQNRGNGLLMIRVKSTGAAAACGKTMVVS